MSSTESRRALAQLATSQGGYFTVRQALSVGYTYSEQHYHVSHHNWERVARGVFRLGDYPPVERDDLIIASLLSHNRESIPQAIMSHETALAIHDLGDANPARLHVTVPPGYRRHLPPTMIVHKAQLTSHDWEEHDGYRVTTPLRTLLDIAVSATEWPLLEPAVRDALRRGIVRRQQLLAADISPEGYDRLMAALRAAQESLGA